MTTNNDSNVIQYLVQLSFLKPLVPKVTNNSRYSEIELLIDILNRGRKTELQDIQEQLLYVNIEKTLRNKLQQIINNLSIQPIYFQKSSKKAWHADVYSKADSLLSSISIHFPNICQHILQSPDVHSLLVNYIILNDISTFTVTHLQEFIHDLFFSCTMTRGGKNKHGIFPPRIAIPIKMKNGSFLLRSAKSIKANSFPSKTVFTNQVLGGSVLNYQDYVNAYLNGVLKIINGDLKHGRMKAEYFAKFLGIKRDPRTKKIGLPHGVKFLRLKLAVGDLMIFDGFLTQNNFYQVMKDVYYFTELLLTHPIIIKEFDPNIQEFLLTRQTKGGKTYGMAAKWLNYQNRKHHKLNHVETKLMDLCEQIIVEMNRQGTTILGNTFHALIKKKFLEIDPVNSSQKKKLRYKDECNQHLRMKAEFLVRKEEFLEKILEHSFLKLLNSEKSSETKRDLAHSYVAGMLGLSKSALTKKLGHRAVMIANDNIILSPEARSLINENLDHIMDRLLNAFNEIVQFLQNGKYVVTMIEGTTNYLEMRKAVRNAIKNYISGKKDTFKTIPLQKSFLTAMTEYLNKKSLAELENQTVLEIFRAAIVILASEIPRERFSLANGSEATYTYLFRTFLARMAQVSDIDLPERMKLIITHSPKEELTSGLKGSATFDEEIYHDDTIMIHEIKHFKIRIEKNRLKINIGKSDPKQKMQRKAVGKIVFSFMSIVSLKQNEPVFVHVFIT